MNKIRRHGRNFAAVLLTIAMIFSLGMGSSYADKSGAGAKAAPSAPGEPIWGTSPISEPYGYVKDGSFSGPPQTYSPDPLVSYRWDDPKASDQLEIFLRKPVKAESLNQGSFSGVESLLTDSPEVTVVSAGSIRLDFGAEFAGWLEIDSPDLSGQITLGMSEYNAPAFVNPGPQSSSKTAVPRKYGNTYRVELNSEYYEGVRFGFINVTNFDRPFHITDVRLVCQTKPVNYNGSFDSDNEMLNKIWYTAAYDVRANLKKDYFAAIIVDRGDRHSWTGDAYPAQAAALPAFGNFDFVLDNLRYTATRSNGIESYELYWILSLIDYYEYTGDRQGVESLLTQATNRLDHAYQVYGQNPGLGFFGWDERLGAGFESPNIAANQNSYKLLAIQAWKDFAGTLQDIGETVLASKYLGYATAKTAELQSDPDFYNIYGLHSAADAINAGVLNSTQTDTLFNKYFTDRVNRLSYSPFNQYFILQAMGKTGKYDDAIASILDMWGGQVAYGGTTFFETFRPQWNDEIGPNDPVPNNQAGYTSLAHPWGAGVLPWMNEEILGIKATTPGFDTFDVKPHLGRQLTRVSGSTATGHGVIKASFNTATGECSVTVPAGTAASVGIPKVEKTVQSILVNGSAASVLSEDSDFVYLNTLSAGTYNITVQYSGQTPSFTQGDYEYAATFVREDAETKGNWGGVYGKDGYVLCSYDNGMDRQHLPDYVESVTYRNAASTVWSDVTRDQRALSANNKNTGFRKIGAKYTGAAFPTATVDIELNEDKEYTVALYFVDWDNKGREIAVEMFDAETLDMIAPVKVIDGLTGGKYLVYTYDKSARFRIDQVRGDNAVISGIFFGEGLGPDISEPEYSSEIFDDRDPNVVYSGGLWTHDPGPPGTYANTFSYSNQTNYSAEFTFEGAGISFLASKEDNRGIAEIFLDGVSQGTFDLYSASALRQQEIFKANGLSTDGPHKIKIVVTGTKNPAASGVYVDIDAFVVRNILLINNAFLEAAIRWAEQTIDVYEDFTEESVAAVQLQLAEAKETLGSGTASQEDRDQAAEDLLTKVDALKAVNNVNIARNKSVTASSQVSTSTFAAKNLTDGTRSGSGEFTWSSNLSTNANHIEWAIIDLGSKQYMNHLLIFPRNDPGDSAASGHAFPKDFTIDLSDDGENWTSVVSEANYPATGTKVQRFDIPTQRARYVRIHATSLNPNPGDHNTYRLQLAEVEIYRLDTSGSDDPDDLTLPAAQSDFNKLSILEAVADSKTQANYTSSSWVAFLAAQADIEPPPALGMASRGEVREAYSALAAAMNHLVLKGSATDLHMAIDLSKEILKNISLYEPDSIAGLPAAIDAAQAVITDADADQDDVNQAVATLMKTLGKARYRTYMPEIVTGAAPGNQSSIPVTGDVAELEKSLNESIKSIEKTDKAVSTANVDSKVKITFTAGKGKVTGVKSKTVIKAAKFGKLPKASRTGYKFKGWYTKAKGGKKITSSSKVRFSKDTKLYAHWTKR